MADYIFQLVIDEMDNRGLFLEEAGGKKFKPAISQDFGECWGVQDSVYERKIFDYWKDSFLSMLLEKYNIDEEDCIVRFQGPKEMHDFFLQERYQGVFEAVGEPIKRIEESQLWKKLDDESHKQFSMENETSVIKFYNDKYIPKLQEKIRECEQENKKLEKEIETNNQKQEQLQNDIKTIKTEMATQKREREKEIDSLKQKFATRLEELYDKFSSYIKNELDLYKPKEKEFKELKDEIKNKFNEYNIESIRARIINNFFFKNSEEKDILTRFFKKDTLDNCIDASIKVSVVKGKEHRFLKFTEGNFNRDKFDNKLQEKINTAKFEESKNLKKEDYSNYSGEDSELQRNLTKKNEELSVCKKKGKNLGKMIEEYTERINKLKEDLTSKQIKVEALNAR